MWLFGHLQHLRLESPPPPRAHFLNHSLLLKHETCCQMEDFLADFFVREEGV